MFNTYFFLFFLRSNVIAKIGNSAYNLIPFQGLIRKTIELQKIPVILYILTPIREFAKISQSQFVSPFLFGLKNGIMVTQKDKSRLRNLSFQEKNYGACTIFLNSVISQCCHGMVSLFTPEPLCILQIKCSHDRAFICLFF